MDDSNDRPDIDGDKQRLNPLRVSVSSSGRGGWRSTPTPGHGDGDEVGGEDVRAARRASVAQRLVAAVAVAVSVFVVVALVVSRPSADEDSGTGSGPTSSATSPAASRGDPALAQRLAQQAGQVSDQDRQAKLRLLLAAHIADPDSVAHRVAIVQALFGETEPVQRLRTVLDAGGPVTYAALSADASYLVTGGAAATIWQTGWISDPPRVGRSANLGPSVIAAAGAGTLMRTTLIVVGAGGEVSLWRAANAAAARPLGQGMGRADTAAMMADGSAAVTVDDTAGTLWDLQGPRATASASMPYDKAVNALAFAPGRTPVVAAGHSDGSVTVYTINVRTLTASKRVLTGAAGAINAVAVSADASTVLAAGTDGALTIWDLGADRSSPAGTTPAATSGGQQRVWLDASGALAFVADTTGAALWSVADPTAPTRLGRLALGETSSVPAMISADGRTVVSIGQGATVSIWDIGALTSLFADPVARACQLADLDEQRWRHMVGDPSLANPCGPAPLASLKVGG